jgi:hypothetical protein
MATIPHWLRQLEGGAFSLLLLQLSSGFGL